MTEKTYPFNATKHAHDIELRYNRVSNELSDLEQTRGSNYDDMAKLETLKYALDDLLSYMRPGIVWLDGKRYGLAKETVNWSTCYRDHKNARR